MVEEQSKRIEQEITRVVDDLDRSYLRKMQVCKYNIKKVILQCTNKVIIK